MNFKTIFQNYDMNIPLPWVAITKVCVDSFSYFSVKMSASQG